MEALEKQAFKYAVKNAYLHDFKANAKAVAGKLKALNKDKDIKELFKIADETTKKVNKLSKEEIIKYYIEFEKEGFELKPKEKEGLPKLEWAEKEKVVTRFAPNPNGPFHLGNARAAIVSYEYARLYNGKFILRFDDTDPKIKKPIENAKEVFLEDLNFLKCKVDEVYFASDRLEIYYEYIRKLLEIGKAYVCLCQPETWREKTKKSIACEHREMNEKETMKLFNEMLSHKLKEGEAVLRIKTDLQHKDPSIRDWWAAKIVDVIEHPNPKVKDMHVWPSYNFASAIDDHLLGTTLIIRGQEHKQNETKQRYIYDYFNWKYPHAFYTGRIKLEKAVLSTSKIKAGIEDGKYIGWDDPRLGTIKALKRRGFKAEALIEILLELGVKPSDTTIEWNTLAALNKKYIAENYIKVPFFVEPIQLKVDFCPEKIVEKDNEKICLQKGAQIFIVDRKQLMKAIEKNKSFRLRNAYNVRLKDINEFEASAEFIGDFKTENVIEWTIECIDLIVLMPNNKEIYGIAGPQIMKANIDDIVYLESFGYARIDEKGKRIKAWFTHK